MKKWLLFGAVIIIGLACLVAIAVLTSFLWPNIRLGYIQRATGIAFPIGLSQVDVYDNLEFYIVAHVKLHEKDVAAFADKHGFSTTPVSTTPWIEALKLQNRTIPANADLQYLEGRSSDNHWLCALDRDSGRLWIVVFYPDPGGTLP
jgi:hypothetical protein